MSVYRKTALCFMAAATMGLLTTSARATFVPGASIVDPGLSGNIDSDVWTNAGLTGAANPGYGGFPGTSAWPGPIQSSQGGDAGLVKVANGAGGGVYPISSGLYFGGVSSVGNTLGGTLAVQDATALAGLANVVFQIQIGEALGYDFFNHALPVLSYNGGSQNLAATVWQVTDQTPNGTFPVPGGGTAPIYINTYLLQWDLSGISGITDFSISFSGVQHGQVYALRLDQSDVYGNGGTAPAVPEPASLALLGCGVAALFVKLRKRD
jgi:PEP-CTERM motif